MPKHERNVQQLIVKVFDYVTFCFIYAVFGFLLSFCFNPKIIKGEIGKVFVFVVLLLFIVTYILLLLNIAVNEKLHRRSGKYIDWIKAVFNKELWFNYIFTIQIALSFIVYSFFIENPILYEVHFRMGYYITLLISPSVFLFTYRSYSKKSKREYQCRVIDEKDFNEAMPIVKYSLDNDKILFSPGWEDLEEVIYLFDRSCSKYFKFTKKENDSI
ncbi:hypothetical protein M3226_30515 [Neobacillus cucumis]|uniref:hypothetical protein n=1 Tax=Neobacillus cucumis TaxID=1740721 RepID=UPI00204141AC|nr:hypothetical protein [Neobacillus cucumis]MCM3729860.1 hypothetical protein [Neobacillus cucumis]